MNTITNHALVINIGIMVDNTSPTKMCIGSNISVGQNLSAGAKRGTWANCSSSMCEDWHFQAIFYK